MSLFEDGGAESFIATVLREKAQERFALLRSQDESYRERAELAAEGIADSRIDALYPFDFAEIIDVLIMHLNAETLVRISKGPELRDAATKVTKIKNIMPEGLYVALDHQRMHMRLRMKYTALVDHIASLLPPDEPGARTAEFTAKGCAVVLWYAFHFMANAKAFGDNANQVHDVFLHVTDMLLPQLKEREQSERAAQIDELYAYRGEKATS